MNTRIQHFPRLFGGFGLYFLKNCIKYAKRQFFCIKIHILYNFCQNCIKSHQRAKNRKFLPSFCYFWPPTNRVKLKGLCQIFWSLSFQNYGFYNKVLQCILKLKEKRRRVYYPPANHLEIMFPLFFKKFYILHLF